MPRTSKAFKQRRETEEVLHTYRELLEGKIGNEVKEVLLSELDRIYTKACARILAS